MITIKEIAKLANVSGATVSRVINNSGYVSDGVRQKVMKIVDENKYVPSEHAKALRTKHSKVIGVILPRISTETASRIVNGINEVLAPEGYQIILASSDLELRNEIKYLKLFKSRQVEGIILNATNTSKELMEEVDDLTIPFVAIGQELKGESYVSYNNYEVAKGLTNYLIKKGHKKIAFIGVDEKDTAVGYDRKKGYLDTMKDHSLSIDENWIKTGSFAMTFGEESMESIMNNSLTTPSAVFAVTDRLAIGAMKYLKKHLYKIPDDIAVVGIGASELAEFVEPGLTTVDFNNEKAGREAAQLILNKIQDKEYKNKEIILNYRLIERDSVR
ncbi:LacI family transcriptional regulator [Salipaludibacillus neizhouensis]|uniref:LacI family transcriptional regulator n=1 Tax=Salipaludibacillus neizhouensis TaxID=885475 RepID=A0A3A9KI30_9BACI|nr:LacI family DNA-binding transcriptional regulator [Salipaludibacillus neizhouensis]RKL67355.1 LacI family transcriptional regulator [Salipaludibacillus neizhouensis]